MQSQWETIIWLVSSIDNTSPYIGGIRDLREFSLVSIVNLSQSLLKNLSVTIEKYASVLFVDVEKKHPFEVSKQDIERPAMSNLISASTQLIPNIPIIGWSPSRATCDATLKSIKKDIGENIGGQKISIIGLGNIGFKLALALVEEGCDVVCYSRDRNKLSSLVEAINYLKSSYTIASASCARNPEIALAASKIIILSASSRNFINDEQLKLLCSNSRIYDVGKDSLTLDAKTLIETRADIKQKELMLERY